jgi:hypothetical protein
VRRTIAKGLSAAVIVASSVRLALLRLCVPLSELPLRLRRVRHLPGPLRNPARLASGVDRLGRFLPPWGMGWCLKRSLLLLDLWSRCGLEPELRIGLRRSPGSPLDGHAWLSAASSASAVLATGAPALEEGFVEAWIA